MEYSDIDFVDVEIWFTEHICKLSKSRKLICERNELSYYITSYKELNVQIEFFNFSRMDEESSDASCGTVSIGFSNGTQPSMAFDFSVGTKQFSNLKKAIAYNFKDWKESIESGGQRYLEVLDCLGKI